MLIAVIMTNYLFIYYLSLLLVFFLVFAPVFKPTITGFLFLVERLQLRPRLLCDIAEDLCMVSTDVTNKR